MKSLLIAAAVALSACTGVFPDQPRVSYEEQQRFNEAKRQETLRRLLTEAGPPPTQAGIVAALGTLRSRLHDPSSFKLVKTEVLGRRESSGQSGWGVRFTYRARNAFGGLVLSRTWFIVRDDVPVWGSAR